MSNELQIRDYIYFKRFIIGMAALLMLLLMGLSVWKSVNEYRLTIAVAEQRAQGYARALREHAERTLSEADTALLDVLEHIEEHGGLNAHSGEQLRKVISTHARNAPQIGAIILVNSQGILFAHSLDTPVTPVSVADREYFVHHHTFPNDDTPFIAKPIKSRVNGKWRFTMSRPVRGSDGSFQGLVAVAFEMEYFQGFYHSLELGGSDRIVMVRRDGQVLLTEPFQEEDLAKNFSSAPLFTKYLPKAPHGVFQVEKGAATLVKDARLVSYESLERYPVVTHISLNRDTIISSWRHSALMQTLFTLIACIGLILLTVVLLRQIKRNQHSYQRQLEQQQEIAGAAASWQSTFDSVADAIWVMDLDRKILRSNKATTTIFGRDMSSIVGHVCCEIAHDGTVPLANCPFQKMLDTGQRADMQLENNGRWFEVSVDPIRDSAGTITAAVHIISDITTLKQAEEQYRTLVDNLPVVIWQTDEKGVVRYISKVVTRIDGYTPEEIYAGGVEQMTARIHPDDQERVITAFTALFRDGSAFDVEFRIKHKAGHWIWLRDFAYDTITIDGMRVAHGVFSDVTEWKQTGEERDLLEMQLRQSQKMEAIGHLAGGVAHDFNNLLTPILGYAEMASAATPAGSPLEPKLAGIIAAANKAKALTQQLLGFGRRQAITTEVLDLNDVILSFNSILRRTIKESIRIDMLLDPDGAFIKADRSQIEQIILNMTVNAQDAFDGHQGRITIETCKILMDGENARVHPGMIPGDYVLLSFRDNGCGMSSEVTSHIFEPFFTTKQAGHGTGLGLATVYGIVKQHDAFIAVASHPGEGTTFNLYFPMCSHVPLLTPLVSPPSPRKTVQDTTILVVEDNDMVREMVQEMLQGYGFTIMTAADPHQAIGLLAAGTHQIDLLVSDVVMPGMSGPELYEQLVARIPQLKVVYISGYPMNPSLRGGILEDDVTYLQKPFTAEALLERIHLVL